MEIVLLTDGNKVHIKITADAPMKCFVKTCANPVISTNDESFLIFFYEGKTVLFHFDCLGLEGLDLIRQMERRGLVMQ